MSTGRKGNTQFTHDQSESDFFSDQKSESDDGLDDSNYSGFTFKLDENQMFLPLHIAVKENNVDVVRRLIENKCDVNQLDGRKPGTGYSALMWACRMGHYEVAVLLVNAGANVNFKYFLNDNYWNTPLSESINCGCNMRVTELLVKNGANIADAEKGNLTRFIDDATDNKTAIALHRLGFSTDDPKMSLDALKKLRVVERAFTDSNKTNKQIYHLLNKCGFFNNDEELRKARKEIFRNAVELEYREDFRRTAKTRLQK